MQLDLHQLIEFSDDTNQIMMFVLLLSGAVVVHFDFLNRSGIDLQHFHLVIHHHGHFHLRLLVSHVVLSLCYWMRAMMLDHDPQCVWEIATSSYTEAKILPLFCRFFLPPCKDVWIERTKLCASILLGKKKGFKICRMGSGVGWMGKTGTKLGQVFWKTFVTNL